MTHFDLKDAHPEMALAIKERCEFLSNKYPFVNLKRVSVDEPDSDEDRSMAYAVGGEIHFNGYWFTQSPAVLNEASHSDVVVPIGSRSILWHGRMFKEPIHVITHEFGHVMADSISGWNDWAEKGWQEATSNPAYAVSGYALANPAEWSAELFAAVELGVALKSQIETFEGVLKSR